MTAPTLFPTYSPLPDRLRCRRVRPAPCGRYTEAAPPYPRRCPHCGRRTRWAPAGLSAARQQLAVQWLPLAHKLAMRFVRDTAARARVCRASLETEALEAAYHAACRAALKYDAARGYSMSTLLGHAVKNQLRRLAADLKRPSANAFVTGVEVLPDVEDECHGTERRVEVREMERQVRMALWQLPDELRRAVAMVHLGGMTAAECARREGVRPEEMRRRCAAGVERMRAWLGAMPRD